MIHFTKSLAKGWCLTLPIAGLGALLPREGEAATDVGVALDLGKDMANGGYWLQKWDSISTNCHALLKVFFPHPNMTDVQL